MSFLSHLHRDKRALALILSTTLHLAVCTRSIRPLKSCSVIRDDCFIVSFGAQALFAFIQQFQRCVQKPECGHIRTSCRVQRFDSALSYTVFVLINPQLLYGISINPQSLLNYSLILFVLVLYRPEISLHIGLYRPEISLHIGLLIRVEVDTLFLNPDIGCQGYS